MHWPTLVSCFFGGVFVMNAIPHLVGGVMGSPFQTPFAKPRGKGLSSSTVNVVWGFFNLVVAYALFVRVGDFQFGNIADVAASGIGAFLIALMLARHFGNFHGGNAP